MSGLSSRSSVVPAQLSFLAIYNPSLGSNDENLHDQVVFYSSKASRARSGRKFSSEAGFQVQHEEENEKLRQIGLAQGMVEFAKSFSDGEAVDSVETEKSRVVLHELEKGWWILASIDLTRLPSGSMNEAKSATAVEDSSARTFEYSAREVCPPALLLQQLLRAHNIFLLHHGPSFGALYERTTRVKFCGILNRFWTRFVWNWEVMLNGNPAVDMFSGLKLAAGGELGIGVGEEEWGSGEREVLEGFIGRIEGLVDLVVSRFGEPPTEVEKSSRNPNTLLGAPKQISGDQQWLGTGTAPRPSDGVIFSGVGAITRTSLRDVSDWMQWLYAYGEDTYGVLENPHSAHRRKRRKLQPRHTNDRTIREDKQAPTHEPSPRGQEGLRANKEHEDGLSVRIPPPIVSAAAGSLSSLAPPGQNRTSKKLQSTLSGEHSNATTGTDTLMKYLTLGVYGSSWGISAARPAVQRRKSDASQRSIKANTAAEQGAANLKHIEPKPEPANDRDEEAGLKRANEHRRYIIGLQGNLEDDKSGEGDAEMTESGTDLEVGPKDSNTRILIRTLHAGLAKHESTETTPNSHDGAGSGNMNQTLETNRDRLRVVVYVHKPFMFTFLFHLETESLAMPSFYRSLHHQLSPLQKALLASTSPDKVSERLQNAFTPRSTASTSSSQPIYDLLYDPSNLTIHTSIPNIPEPGTPAAEGLDLNASPWSRVEALNVHTQILNTHVSTRHHSSELERTGKTSRGWWVVWMRLPHAPTTSKTHSNVYREAFLVRKASDHMGAGAKKSSGMFGFDGRASSGGSGWGPAKLAEGIGIDTRKYIEDLLSLNR